MRNVLIFLILMALVVCPPPEFNREERQNRRKEFQKQMVDCLLNSEGISADFKKQIEDNKDDDLRKVLHTFMTKLDSNDREVIRKCRRELFSKTSDNMGRIFGRPNITDFHRFKEKLTEKKNAN